MKRWRQRNADLNARQRDVDDANRRWLDHVASFIR